MGQAHHLLNFFGIYVIAPLLGAFISCRMHTKKRCIQFYVVFWGLQINSMVGTDQRMAAIGQ